MREIVVSSFEGIGHVEAALKKVENGRMTIKNCVFRQICSCWDLKLHSIQITTPSQMV